MRKINLPDKLKFDIEVSFTNFGEFRFKEISSETKSKKQEKPAAIYVFPRTTAAITEL